MSERSSLCSLLVALIVVGVAACTAARAGDVQNGQVLASQVCALCHQLPDAPERRTGVAPPFRALAANRIASPDQLARFLRGQHHPFGMEFLNAQQVEDVAAYVMSLRQ